MSCYKRQSSERKRKEQIIIIKRKRERERERKGKLPLWAIFLIHPSHFLFFLGFSLYLSLETLTFFFKTEEEKIENGFSECYMCSGSCIGVECVSGISGRHSSPRRGHSSAAWLRQQLCAGTTTTSSCFVEFRVFYLSRTYCLDDEKTEGKYGTVEIRTKKDFFIFIFYCVF